MKFCRRRLCSFTWIALFAVIGLALAPTVSHALARGGAAGGVNPWAELCSAATSQPAAAAVAAHATTEVPPQALATPFDHCPLCGHAGCAAVLPTAPPASFHAAGCARFVPASFSQSRRPQFAWAVAQPRGPPARS